MRLEGTRVPYGRQKVLGFRVSVCVQGLEIPGFETSGFQGWGLDPPNLIYLR